MGNCLRRYRRSRSSVAALAFDEDTRSQISCAKTEHEAAESGVTVSGTEVKIKLTKKQLTELYTKVEQQGLPVGEVLAQLLESNSAAVDGGSGESEMRRQQSWRPVLQSIPEIDQLK